MLKFSNRVKVGFTGLVVVGVSYLLAAGRVGAQGLLVPETVNEAVTLRGLEAIFNNLVVIVVGVAGIAVFIMLIMGGVQFITSGGEQPKVVGAKKTLTYAILGLVLLISALLIMRLIEAFTGVKVTVFQIYKG